MGRGPVILQIPWTVMEHVMRLSREERVPEFRELDLRVMRQTVAYIMEAMRGRTMASLALHVQQLIMHVLEQFHLLSPGQQHQGGPAASPPPHLPGSVRQLNTVLGIGAAEDVGLSADLLQLRHQEGVALVRGEGMASPGLIDLKVLRVSSSDCV